MGDFPRLTLTDTQFCRRLLVEERKQAMSCRGDVPICPIGGANQGGRVGKLPLPLTPNIKRMKE